MALGRLLSWRGDGLLQTNVLLLLTLTCHSLNLQGVRVWHGWGHLLYEVKPTV